jgi:hypothetical protein
LSLASWLLQAFLLLLALLAFLLFRSSMLLLYTLDCRMRRISLSDNGYRTEFLAFFSSAEWFGAEFREFSVPRNSQNSAGTKQLFRLFRLLWNNFFVRNCQP